MKTLVVITGPTAVGKTELSLQMAKLLSSPVISADSRQMFRQMTIGTAAPTSEEQLTPRLENLASASIPRPIPNAEPNPVEIALIIVAEPEEKTVLLKIIT